MCEFESKKKLYTITMTNNDGLEETFDVYSIQVLTNSNTVIINDDIRLDNLDESTIKMFTELIIKEDEL